MLDGWGQGQAARRKSEHLYLMGTKPDGRTHREHRTKRGLLCMLLQGKVACVLKGRACMLTAAGVLIILKLTSVQAFMPAAFQIRRQVLNGAGGSWHRAPQQSTGQSDGVKLSGI